MSINPKDAAIWVTPYDIARSLGEHDRKFDHLINTVNLYMGVRHENEQRTRAQHENAVSVQQQIAA